MRIVHCADLQLGKAFGSFLPDEAVLLATARLDAVRAIAALAIEHRADAILVAGDCFETNAVLERTIRQAFAATQGFSGPWVLIPGNHDAALAESVWTRAQRLGAVPDNVHLCLTPEPLVLADGRMVILPAPLTQRLTQFDLTAWFDSHLTPPGAARVGLAHGSVVGVLPEDATQTNPIAPDRAERARLDYLALGDWHGTFRVNARTWYSGTPETDRFRDNDSGNVLLVDIEPGEEPVVTPVRVSRYRWQTTEAMLVVPTDVDQLVENLDRLQDNDVVQLKPTGNVTLEQHRRICNAVARAQGRVRALRFNEAGLRLALDENDLNALKADGYVATVINQLREQQAGADDETAAVARESLMLLANFLDTRGDAGAVQCA